MPQSMLAAVHAAVSGAPDETPTPSGAATAISDNAMTALAGVLATADTGDTEGNDMATNANQPAAGGNASEKQIADARAEGAAAEGARIAAALGAEGVKGDGGRMAAALDLAAKAPGMAGADIAAFVTANVPAGAATQPTQEQLAAARDERRLAGAGAGVPQGGQQGGQITWAEFRKKNNRA